MAPQIGDINPSNSVDENVAGILNFAKPSGVLIGVPFTVTEALAADALVHGVQNPCDSDCLVAAILNVETIDATETIDVGSDGDGTGSSDNLLDAGDVGTGATTLSSFSDADTGTNGVPWVKVDKKGGTTDYLTFTATAGTDTLAGTVTFIFIPLAQ